MHGVFIREYPLIAMLSIRRCGVWCVCRARAKIGVCVCVVSLTRLWREGGWKTQCNFAFSIFQCGRQIFERADEIKSSLSLALVVCSQNLPFVRRLFLLEFSKKIEDNKTYIIVHF